MEFTIPLEYAIPALALALLAWIAWSLLQGREPEQHLTGLDQKYEQARAAFRELERIRDSAPSLEKYRQARARLVALAREVACVKGEDDPDFYASRLYLVRCIVQSALLLDHLEGFMAASGPLITGLQHGLIAGSERLDKAEILSFKRTVGGKNASVLKGVDATVTIALLKLNVSSWKGSHESALRMIKKLEARA